ncbi:hypothetical protein [Oceanispirochaeta sp. M1]|uniref:hypothetical protein n=1 Tax=Oceanispirochaeta sp. M1 TaxID=2283433 RepID=UPI000E099053|nr:hypothetical protein [Oceanispirochaeta sp. M1]NPD75319.1 hypothetical protein [Oceanispirochaeta sp. M1]RDG28842.1 hypothetical protein DV872_24800 [Oceanispirochaeta sp. M1]
MSEDKNQRPPKQQPQRKVPHQDGWNQRIQNDRSEKSINDGKQPRPAEAPLDRESPPPSDD